MANEKPREGRDDLSHFLVAVNRVCKVVKGGKRFNFSSLVVVGDGRGRVGFAKGRAKEAPSAVSKATSRASSSMIKVSLFENRTLYHDVQASFGACIVLLRAAPEGTGLIAGGAVRLVLEALGVKDIVAKIIKSGSPGGIVRATFSALSSMQTPRFVANKRGLKLSEASAVVSEENKQ